MLLKAGTYRFNDELDMSNIPTGQDNDYSVDIQYNFTINGLGDVLFDCDCIQIGNYTEETGGKWFRVSIDKSTPDVSSMFWGYMRPYENGVWGEGYEDYIDVDTLKNVTIPYDQEVDDTFGTWYITNTNYNEVNAEDTIYTEKSSWYKSVADAIRNKKGTTAPILRDDFASEISSITGGGETPYYDGTVIIEKAESVLGLRRFKESVSVFKTITITSDLTSDLETFYSENYITIPAITDEYGNTHNGISPLVSFPIDENGTLYNAFLMGFDGVYIELFTLDEIINMFGGVINVLSTSNTSVDEWLLANTEGVSV